MLLVDGVSIGTDWSAALGMVGEAAGEAREEALEGIEALEGPLPLFHAAALRRASKLVGRSTSEPSSLAMTHPLRRLFERSAGRSVGAEDVVAIFREQSARRTMASVSPTIAEPSWMLLSTRPM